MEPDLRRTGITIHVHIQTINLDKILWWDRHHEANSDTAGQGPFSYFFTGIDTAAGTHIMGWRYLLQNLPLLVGVSCESLDAAQKKYVRAKDVNRISRRSDYHFLSWFFQKRFFQAVLRNRSRDDFL
jgi:hypothetical protein